MHCDDVVIEWRAERWHVQSDGCSIADQFIHRSGLTSSIEIEPGNLIATAGVDLVTARDLERRDAAGTIRVALIENPSIAAFQTTSFRDGTFSATIGDVRTHSDRVLLLGDVDKAWPRLRRQLTDPGRPDQVIDAAQRLQADAAAGWLIGDLPPVLRGAFNYAAVVIGPNAFASGQEDLTAAMLHRWFRAVNQSHRAVGMTLDAAATLRSVWWWRRNEAPPGLGQRTADVVLSAVSGHPVAGLDFASAVVRGDGSVTLPLTPPWRPI